MTTAKSKTEKPPILDEAQQAGLKPLEGDVMPFGVALLPAASEYGQASRVSDLIPSPAAWAEFAQRELDAILNTDFVILDVMYFDSTIQVGAEWFIAKLTDPATGETFTTAGGGEILVRKLRKLQDFPIQGEHRNMLPCVGRFTRTPSQTKGHSPYYDLI